MSETVLRRIRQAMERWRWRAVALAVAMLLAIALFSWFGVTPPDRTAEQSFISRAEARHHGAVTLRAAVLTDDESQRYFGASLADHGIQAIWLGVDNASESPLEFLPIVTDPEYFSEAEVEQILQGWWRGSANASIKAAVAGARMPDVVLQRQAAAGFVFTHREGGLKLFGVGFETGSEELLFRFALPVRGGSYAIEKVDFSNIYPPGSVEDIDLTTLRERLAKLACCTT